MPSLAVFDFDRTVIDDDSDAAILRRVKQKRPIPSWDGGLGGQGWTPYMSNIFELAHSAGLSQEDILSAISSIKPIPGVELLIRSLADEGWDILVLTDANTVFVNHWLKTHDLMDAVTSVITNRAFFQDGRLHIEPCMNQTSCPRCPDNMCKNIALRQWCGGRRYDTVVYSGDGRNDFCPATLLGEQDTVFARRGFPIHELIKNDYLAENRQIKAKVVLWDDSYTILKEVLPEKAKNVIINM